MDSFDKIPPAEFVGLPFHFWSQMILCVTVLKYLSVLEDPAWDRQAARNTVDLVSTIDCMVRKLDQSSEEPGFQCDDSLFKLLSKLLNKSRIWAEGRMAPQTQDGGAMPHDSTGSDAASHSSSYIPDLDQMVWIQSMDLENDQWFEETMGWPTGSF